MIKFAARAMLVLTGSAVYLALAILGWGGAAAFFAGSARIALALVLALLAIVSCFAGGNVSRGVREDRGNRWVLVPFGVIGLALGCVPAWTDRCEIFTVDGESVRWLGVAFAAIGGALRLWPVFVLGKRFSGLVAIQPGHALVTDGIYGRIRNPSYLGLLLFSLGWSLAFRAGAGVVLTALFIPPLIARINAEERLLSSQFGADYEAYRARTTRLIPYLY